MAKTWPVLVVLGLGLVVGIGLRRLSSGSHGAKTRALDYIIGDPQAFLRETLLACPLGSVLEVNWSWGLALDLKDGLKDYELPVDLFAGPGTHRYAIRADNQIALAALLSQRVDQLREAFVSLRLSTGDVTWCESPHFESDLVFLHDGFPSALAAHLVAAGVIAVHPCEVEPSVVG